MIFLILVAIIAVIVMGLNWHDNNNLQTIENYLKAKQCQNIVYSKGAYKGLCQEGVYIVPNSFSLDIKKSETVVQYVNIKSVEQQKSNLLLHTQNEEVITIEFKDDKNIQNYMKQLQE